MSVFPKACRNKYFPNYSDVRGQINVMPGFFDEENQVLRFFASSPFLILGLSTYKELPEGETPNFPNSKIIVSPAVDQDANSEWVQALFIAMGFANGQPQGVSNGQTAYASTSFSEYMYNYLNPSILASWYNLYISPSAQIIQFWKDQHTLNVPANDSKALRDFARYLSENAFLPLYNPPGVYEINTDGNTEPYGADLAAYMAANDNVVNLYCEMLNCMNLVDADIVGNPLANTIDSINYAGEVPDAILWL
jgi:hypothetical protein